MMKDSIIVLLICSSVHIFSVCLFNLAFVDFVIWEALSVLQ